MKHFRHAWMLWIFGGGILGSSLFAGCNNDDPVTPDAQPEIVFAKESLDVPAEGGPFQIEYTIENPVANATLSAKCNDSWITDIDTKTAGVISFNVTKNETAEKREAIIEVSYADIQPAPSFTAKQAARPEEAFTITISDITTKTFRTTVRPGDQEMYYLLNIIPSRAAADLGGIVHGQRGNRGSVAVLHLQCVGIVDIQGEGVGAGRFLTRVLHAQNHLIGVLQIARFHTL